MQLKIKPEEMIRRAMGLCNDPGQDVMVQILPDCFNYEIYLMMSIRNHRFVEWIETNLSIDEYDFFLMDIPGAKQALPRYYNGIYGLKIYNQKAAVLFDMRWL